MHLQNRSTAMVLMMLMFVPTYGSWCFQCWTSGYRPFSRRHIPFGSNHIFTILYVRLGPQSSLSTFIVERGYTQHTVQFLPAQPLDSPYFTPMTVTYGVKDTVELEFDSTVITMKPTFNVAHLRWSYPNARDCQIVTEDRFFKFFSPKIWMLGKQLSFCLGNTFASFRFGEG